MDQLALMYRLMVLMTGRFPRQPVDAAFVFGRAQGDYEATDGDAGILETAAALYHQELTPFLSFPGTKGKLNVDGVTVSTTYPGPEVFGQRLHRPGYLVIGSSRPPRRHPIREATATPLSSWRGIAIGRRRW